MRGTTFLRRIAAAPVFPFAQDSKSTSFICYSAADSLLQYNAMLYMTFACSGAWLYQGLSFILGPSKTQLTLLTC